MDRDVSIDLYLGMSIPHLGDKDCPRESRVCALRQDNICLRGMQAH